MKISVLALTLLLTGCAYLHGIYRDAPTKSFPPPEDVLAVLKQIPEVKTATYFAHDGRTPLDRSLGLHKGKVEEFSIRGERAGYNMQFTTRDDRKNITMQMFTHESRPASFRVEEVRNLMHTVYIALRARFPELPPEQEFHEIAEGLELETK